MLDLLIILLYMYDLNYLSISNIAHSYVANSEFSSLIFPHELECTISATGKEVALSTVSTEATTRRRKNEQSIPWLRHCAHQHEYNPCDRT